MHTSHRVIRGRVRRSILVFVLASIAGGMMLGGCATTKPNYSAFVFPPPPDTARLALLDVIKGRDDFGTSFLSVVAGRGRGDMFVKPSGVAFDTSGNLVVIDALGGGVLVFDEVRREVRTIADGHMKLPIAAAVDSKNMLYIVDPRAEAVLVYTMDGKYQRTIGKPGQLVNAAAVVLDERRGRVYVSDSHKHDIMIFDMQGDSVGRIGSRGDSALQFNFPTNMAIDSAGDVYVVDAMNFRVQVVAPDGKLVRQFGSNGDGLGQFARPRGIAVDYDRNVYVTDVIFQNFQIFGPDGELRMFVGQPGTGPAEFGMPSGMAFDGKNRIAVVDQLNRRVQLFKYLGQPK